MASDEFIIKKESEDVDLSLNNLKTLYSVKEKYRRRQKNSAGNYIPFVSIDKSIYTDQGNCACFITSEDRIHYWISAITQIL
jgi:hypothetical protein